jgi:hypothetical protein
VQPFPPVPAPEAIVRLLISRPYVSNGEHSIIYISDKGINDAEEKSEVIVFLLQSLSLMKTFVGASFIINW